MKKTLLSLAVWALVGPAYASSMDINLGGLQTQTAASAPSGSGASNANASATTPATVHAPVATAPATAAPANTLSTPVKSEPAATSAKAEAPAPAVKVNTPATQLPLQAVKKATRAESSVARAETVRADTGPSGTTAQNAAAPTSAVAAAQTPASAAPAAVNPFTGANLGTEVLQRRLEQAKSETQLLEEQLKQATLRADMDNLPAKKRAEVAQFKGAEPVATPPAKVVEPVKKPVKHKAAPVKAVASVEVTRPEMPIMELEGVSVDNGAASAILSFNGNTSIVPNGGGTPFGPLQVLNTGSVRVGGTVLHVHAETLARVKISDPKPVDPKTAGQSAPIFPAVGGLPAGKAPALPPIPLPPSK